MMRIEYKASAPKSCKFTLTFKYKNILIRIKVHFINTFTDNYKVKFC